MNELVKIREVFARNKPPQTSGKSTLCSHHLLVQEDTSTPQAKTTEEEAFLESERELSQFPRNLVQENKVWIVQKLLCRFHTRKVFFLHRT